MKKKPLLLTCYVCLLLCFLFGTAELLSRKEERLSETENRMLRGFPQLSGEALVSGDYMEQFESYLSDAFFFREEAADLTDRLMGVFDGGSEEIDDGEVDEEQLFAPEDGETEGETVPVPVTEELPAETAPVLTADQKTDPASLRDAEFYLLRPDGSKKVNKTYPAEELAAFADILNSYRAALPEDGTLHFCVPPVSSVFNLIGERKEFAGWGSDVEDVLQPVVNDGIYIYDVADILTPYIGRERLYPAGDHHWQPFSASLVAETMLENQGIPSMDYYEYRFRLSVANNAKVYYGDEIKTMKLGLDFVHLLEPVSPVDAHMLKMLDQFSKGTFTDKSKPGLMYYLGGLRRGPWRHFDTGFHTGRNAMVIGDSFELTFTPFLIPYYDTVLVTDLRESLYIEADSGATVREYIEKYDVSDIYMIYSTYSPFCGETTRNNLTKYLG